MTSPPKKTSPTRNGKRTKKRKFNIKRFLMTVLILMLIASAVVGVYVVSVAAKTPAWDPKALHETKQSSLVFDMDSNQIAKLYADENRNVVTYEEIPKLVQDTFVAVEDKRFWDHYGVDPYRIMASVVRDIQAGGYVQGASTITIQLAKNAFIENPTEKKLSRKIQEAILALQLERKYTKEEILTMYLNEIFFGEMSFGIKAAADTYFGKELKDLKPYEVAVLAGLPQAPSTYDPYINPESAKKRRNIVLGVMKDAGIITAQEFTQYKDLPIELKRGAASKNTVRANYQFPWFVDYVVALLQKEPYNLSPEQIFSGGLRIYTTVDPTIQTAAEKVFADPANFPKKGNSSIPDDDPMLVEGAMAVIEPSTGAVRALIGGREYTPGGYNRAFNFDPPGVRGGRQPGSTIKPLVTYGPAIEKGGYFPGTVLDDMPVEYPDNNGVYAPKNFDTWHGLITMREALKQSVNVYAVKLLNQIGVDYGWTFAKERLGLPLEPSDKVLALTLGTPNVYPLDMASAYGVYANNGVRLTRNAIVKVEDSKGNVLVTPTVKKERVMKETTAYLISSMLQSVVKESGGTGGRANFSNAWAIAGKTGTTSLDPAKYGPNKIGSPDAWFAGYTSKYAGVVWLGYDKDEDKKHYLNQVYGGSYPAEIWKKVMTEAHKDLKPVNSWPLPAGIISGKIDAKSGLLPSSLTPEEFIRTEIGAVGDFPTAVSDVWVETEVDADNPQYLANESTLNRQTKVFLVPPGRDPDVEWVKSELPYKMPTEYAPDSGTVGDTEGDSEEDSEPVDSDPITNPPQGDNSLPQINLAPAVYDASKQFVELALLSPPDDDAYTIVVYAKIPDQPDTLTYLAEKWPNNIISVPLSDATSGNPPPGDYYFWVAVQDRESGTIGPASNRVKLKLKAKTN